ncbi:Gfo/Idh/MocA family protein [Fodinicola acaciae]|uniref:Gfo/Idh/MocA family protein n=1 Tax=Fodinicola acaciae TaxID=2681555 RepID=UPI0013D5176E|nr:Gfo/Idh/MocA family oxidoreductase [Fodinicola acaciae]
MKVGVLSLAHIHAPGYVKLLAARPDVTLAIADPGGAEMAESAGAEFHSTYESLLAAKPDAVVVCAENTRHRALVELAAAAGAHVLCEKPLATSTADAVAMIDACEKAGVALMTAFPVRFSPAFQSVRNLVSSGSLGDVIAAVGTNNGKLPPDEYGWFTEPELSGGGAMIDHIVHVADLLEALFSARPATVYAQSNRITYAHQARVETGGIVTVQYDNGLKATIDCSWNRPPAFPTWGGLTLELVGTAGIVDVDPFAQAVTGFADGAVHYAWGDDLDALMLEEFLSATAAGRAPQPGGAASLRTVQIVEAAYLSARTNEPVTIAS